MTISPDTLQQQPCEQRPLQRMTAFIYLYPVRTSALALALAAFATLGACGGRIARPVATDSPVDTLLSCNHLAAEYEVNLKKIEDLAGERLGKVDDNLGWILVMPLFIDLSGAEQREIEALVARNNRLVELAGGKGCEGILPIRAGDGSVENGL